MTPEEHANATAWWDTCFDCLTSVVIYPHWEAEKDLPPQDEWDSYGVDYCPVCGAGLHLNSSFLKQVSLT